MTNTDTFKSFKTYRAAKAFANGGPIVRIGNLYIATHATDTAFLAQVPVELIAANGAITANVTLHHFERLGNANYAERKMSGQGGPHKVFAVQATQPTVR